MIAGAVVSAAGTLVGSEMSASAMEGAGEVRAAGLRQAATESRAAGQREMFEQQRKARLALSTLRARSAATGSADDTDVIKLGADIAARGEYQALAEMYTGENRARGLEDEAAATQWSAKAQAKATRVGSYFKAAGTILSGVGGAMKPSGATLPDAGKLGDSGAYAYG